MRSVLVAVVLTWGVSCNDPSSSLSGQRADAGPVREGPNVVSTTLVPLIPLVKGQPTRLVLQLADDRPAVSGLRARLGDVGAATSRFDEAGRLWVLLVHAPIDSDEQEVTLRLEGETAEGPNGFVLEQRYVLIDGDYDERHIKVANKYVKPPRKERKRIAQESKDIARALEDSAPQRLWNGSFIRPTRTKETSPYGTKRIYNKRKKPTRHLGWDLDGERGDPIQAIQSGRVVMVQKRYYSGGTVVIDHGQSLFSLYFHMSAFDVRVGDDVVKGQLIGDVGSSGRVTGPHLHLSVKLDGHYTDPETLLGINLDADPRSVPPRELPESRFSKLSPPESSSAATDAGPR